MNNSNTYTGSSPVLITKNKCMKKQITWVIEYEIYRFRRNGTLKVDYYKIGWQPQENQRGYNAAMVKAWFQRNNPDTKVISVVVEKHEPDAYKITT